MGDIWFDKIVSGLLIVCFIVILAAAFGILVGAISLPITSGIERRIRDFEVCVERETLSREECLRLAEEPGSLR